MSVQSGSGRPWWPGFIVPCIGLAAIAVFWLLPDRIGQERVLFTIGAALLTTLLTVVWTLGFSPLRRRGRIRVALLLLLAVAGAAATLRIKGVTGDFLPILEWRWARQPALPTAPAVLAPLERDAGPAAAPPASMAPGTASSASASTAEAPPALEPDPAISSLPPGGGAPAVAVVDADTSAAPHRSLIATVSFPQFLGPERNGVLPSIVLAADWRSAAPRLAWRHPVGPAWSGFAVAEGLALTQEQRGGDEAVIAYDLATGAVRWTHAYRARYATVISGEGPRATPTIADGLVFTMGSTGVLSALELQTGRRRWQHDVPRDHGAPDPEWGRSSSPLVIDRRVIVNAGGPDGKSLVAYDAASGTLDWQGGSDRVGYASPVEVTLAGVRQVVAFNEGSVAGHDPHTGALLWEQAWPRGQPNVAQPLPVGEDRLLVSSGYGVGSKLLRITRTAEGRLEPRVLWDSPRLKSKFANIVLYDGFVYGLDDGVLVCLDLASGERRWKGGRYGHGQLLLVGGLLLVQTEDGDVVLVRPRPEAHVELTRFTALEGKTWNPPALAGRYLLVRNDREAAMYELP